MAGVPGAGGKPRTPRAHKELKGLKIPKSHSPNQPKIKPIRSEMAPPPGMSPQGKEAWKQFQPILVKMGILTIADPHAVKMLCEAWSDWVVARTALMELPSRFVESCNEKTGTVTIKAHPALFAVSEADARVRRWFNEFGLTPASRSKVSSTPGTPEEADDPLDELLTS